jgi:lipopolysaccharide/colanic/teichoic acid biosynthesis glycosyltransferase
MIKRVFDLVCVLPGLLVLGPLLAVIALWIKIDSPGAVLFRQKRVGRHGRVFEILKFRTMRVGAERQGPLVTAADDPRITRSGKLLRRWKLDELPQLVNVLRGDMSLVGPRPEVPEYVRHYPSAVRELVLSVRPGLTDWASIEYRDESRLLAAAADRERMYLEEILPRKLAWCERYVASQSLALDLRLILMTLACLAFPKRKGTV